MKLYNNLLTNKFNITLSYSQAFKFLKGCSASPDDTFIFEWPSI